MSNGERTLLFGLGVVETSVYMHSTKLYGVSVMLIWVRLMIDEFSVNHDK